LYGDENTANAILRLVSKSIRESRPGVPVDIRSKIKVYNEGCYPYKYKLLY
jgi:hypothetical protein